MTFKRSAVLAAALASSMLIVGASHAQPAKHEASEKVEVVKTLSGAASWYGGKFHGRRTANGERYDMNKHTAAHKSLPFGTKVRVTNRINGKSVAVRINDRGPFTGNRIIDLSRGAAGAVDMIGTGIAPVIIEIMS
jgi:rare lipoprotein A